MKCPVCGKVLQGSNKLGLCTMDGDREKTLNWRHQGFYDKWRSSNKEDEK